MNLVILKGRLSRDPDVRTTQSGRQVARFTVAVDMQRAKDGQQTADFVPCIAWEKTAELMEKHFYKGKEILVEGRVSTRSYEGEDGKKKYVTEVTVSRVEFCGSKGDSKPQDGGYAGDKTEHWTHWTHRTPTYDDDIPF